MPDGPSGMLREYKLCKLFCVTTFGARGIAASQEGFLVEGASSRFRLGNKLVMQKVHYMVIPLYGRFAVRWVLENVESVIRGTPWYFRPCFENY